MERKGMAGEGMAFADIDEVEHALAAGAVHLHAKIKARLRQVDDEGNIVWKRFETTPGRLRLGNLLPLNAKAPFELVNRLAAQEGRADRHRHRLPLLRPERVGHFL
jgi:DNA-directed RNA polymerase subunit beta'